MDETTKEQIFDPFFSTKGDKGTGLGLSQVFGIVKRANGIIKVYSELNHGSKFVLYFPRYLEDYAENIIDASDHEVDLTGNESILIVDDEDALRDLASELLEGQGYHVVCAKNGKQALKILNREHIDLILSDVIMPEMDGYKLAALVKEKYPAIKIQLASGFTDDRHVEMVDEILHHNLLHKPYRSQVLFEHIRALLNNKDEMIFKKTEKKSPAGKNNAISVIWTDALSVGIPAMDKDHKILLSLLNRCIEVANGTKQNNELGVILDKLIDYTQHHFQREEQILEACEYPLLHKHKKVHQLLIKEVQQHKKQYDQGNLTAYPLLDFLRSWLTEHITGMDKAAAIYCEGKEKMIQHLL